MADRRTLLRGGYVLTIDEAIGDFPVGDVLIEGDRIAAVGAELDEPADEVIDVGGRLVLPGLIDTHTHLWHTPLRGSSAEMWGFEYFAVVHPLTGRYRPQEMYAATEAGAIEYLAGGVTTLLDFCHAVNSPEHADASIAALRSAGVRALYGYGFRDRKEYEPRAYRDHAHRVQDAHRLHAEHFADDDGLVGMAIGLNNMEHVDAATNAAELGCARDLGIVSTVHSIIGGQIATLHDRGLLGRDLIWAHSSTASEVELAWLAEDGGMLSVTAESELSFGWDTPSGRGARLGIPVGIGVDNVSSLPCDLFRQMRFTFVTQRLRDGLAAHMDWRQPSRTDGTPVLDARKVLRMATLEGAEVLGLADRTGSLTPGKQADVVVLSTEPFGLGAGDPAARVVMKASPADVERVYVAGRERVRDGAVLDVDMERLRARLDETRDHVLAAGMGGHHA